MNIIRKKRSDLVVRFHAGYVVNEVTGCWEWQKNIQANGYGHIKEGGKAKLVHRVSFALHKGPIPEGLTCYTNAITVVVLTRFTCLLEPHWITGLICSRKCGTHTENV